VVGGFELVSTAAGSNRKRELLRSYVAPAGEALAQFQ
jgi:hypothetical protein